MATEFDPRRSENVPRVAEDGNVRTGDTLTSITLAELAADTLFVVERKEKGPSATVG